MNPCIKLTIHGVAFFKNVKAYLPEVGVVTTNIGFEDGKIVPKAIDEGVL